MSEDQFYRASLRNSDLLEQDYMVSWAPNTCEWGFLDFYEKQAQKSLVTPSSWQAEHWRWQPHLNYYFALFLTLLQVIGITMVVD